jgi:hypothetical protein
MAGNTNGVAPLETPIISPSGDLPAQLHSDRVHPFHAPDWHVDANLRRCSPMAWTRRSGGKEPLPSHPW